MCGIAGVVRYTGLTAGDLQASARTVDLLRQRGPDGSGRYQDSHCALVQTRLAMVGPPRQTLPLQSRDGRYTIVYNGEVYNAPELRRELADTHSWDGSDTQVVLAAWMRWGEQSLSHLDGMFAFFVWDVWEQRGFAATDPLGIKPLFYAVEDHERFVFASQPGALIESGAVAFRPEPEAIAEALVAPYFSSSVQLPFRGVQRLLPGHWLAVTGDRSGRTTRYFQFSHGLSTAEPAADEVADTLQQAITAATRADAPLGLFLSGGLDSSLLAALTNLPAWTISYDGQEHANYAQSLIVKSDDLPFATRVAARHGCPHHVVHVDEQRYEAALLRTVHANDLISAWEQEISQQILAEAAAAEVKGVLVGDAADETHFGYSFLLNPERIAEPRRILEFFGCTPLRRSLLDDPVAYFNSKYRKFAEDLGYSWKNTGEQRLAMSSLIVHFWLTRLLWNGDVHLMAHSLEGRVPFGNRPMLALAQRITQDVGYKDGIEKWHLRRAAERFLEPEVAWRPKSALTKNLSAARVMHRQFARAWREWGGYLEPFVDSDAVEQMVHDEAVSLSEVEIGIRFRLLSVLTWLHRFAGAPAA